MKVVVCTFTEGDLDFEGRCFSSLSRAREVFAIEQQQALKDFEASSVKELEDFGYLTFETKEVE